MILLIFFKYIYFLKVFPTEHTLTCLGRVGLTSSTLLVFILVFISCLCWRTALSLGPSQALSLLGFRMVGISLTPSSGCSSTASTMETGETVFKMMHAYFLYVNSASKNLAKNIGYSPTGATVKFP